MGGALPVVGGAAGAEPQYRRPLHGGRGPACGGRSLRGGASVSEAAPRWAGPCLWWAEPQGRSLSQKKGESQIGPAPKPWVPGE